MLRRLLRWISPSVRPRAGFERPEPVTVPALYPDDSSMLEDTSYPFASSSMLPLEHNPRSHF